MRKRQKPIIYTCILALGLTIPTLLYTKSLIDHAYEDLESLRDAKSQTEIESLIHASRGNFERANLLFTPFRIFPGDQSKLARIAIDGGLALTRGLDRVIADLPAALSGSSVMSTGETLDARYRPRARDISPLAMLGITEPTKWMREHMPTIEYL